MFIAQEITLTPPQSISTLNDANVTKQQGKRLNSLCVSYNRSASNEEESFTFYRNLLFIGIIGQC